MTQYAGTAKLAATIPLTDTNTPYNSSAVNAPDAANRDSIVAFEAYGLYSTTLNSVKPPYPLAGNHVNSGTYQLESSGASRFEFDAARTYLRSAHSLAWYKTTTWFGSFNEVPPKPYYRQDSAVAAASDDALVFFFDPPSLCTLEFLKFWIDPADSHVAVPGVIPKVEVYIGNIATGVATLIVTADGYEGTGSYADVAQYQAAHRIIADLSSTSFDAGANTLFAKIYGEAAPNQVDDLIVNVPWIEFTRTRIGEEFGELAP